MCLIADTHAIIGDLSSFTGLNPTIPKDPFPLGTSPRNSNPISDGCCQFIIAIVRNISVASNTYRKASVVNKYPLYPCKYSITLNKLRIRIKMLVVYRTVRYVFQRTRGWRDAGVGECDSLMWNTPEATMKSPNTMSWTNNPPMITFWPSCCFDASLFAVAINAPPVDCIRKDSTSPDTNIFVNHVRRMKDLFSPSVRRMIRPKIM